MSDGIHLAFELQPTSAKRKTKIWNVVAQEEYRLGEVRWHAPWRRYTFHPDAKTLYDPGCLHTIADFCAIQTGERKEARKQERETHGGH